MIIKCNSMNEVIEVLKKYKTTLQNKHSQFMARLLNEGFTLANSNLNSISSIYKGNATISIGVEDKGKTITGYVYLNGDKVAFIEFGSGVTFNGNVGTSPPPKRRGVRADNRKLWKRSRR